MPGCEHSRTSAAREKLRRVLVPRDPDDGRDVILEIKAGEGGAEWKKGVSPERPPLFL